MANGTTDWESIIYSAATSPRRISVDGVDYSSHSLSELIQAKRDTEGDSAFCNGFRANKRQVAISPNALGINCPGGRIW